MPFVYPDSAHVRLHGPYGYSDYQRFRPWLRDEFRFRCVYCLKREQWGLVRRQYDLDHFLPQAHSPAGVLDYDNLLYACSACNSAKGKEIVPNACECMLHGQVFVNEDGTIEGRTTNSRRLIRMLGLDDAEYREFRRMWIDVVALARGRDPDLFQRLMKYPDNLPNLATLRPVGNSRPQGVRQSCYARRQRGQLPETY
jgi:hypothetical protein